ncbi:precorrin-2 dehydrogenase/sirohydrochlorin ferrochelatase family protein [Sphingobacterium sp. HJSM2_6]|uniref:precorrin-2 dehydrogenase/sirohydrochlorin ferrochelatase family protein n=1 Tax=Sphingobacterium sp. HJSM2_6 TaxID=3366264 RepID=UPI003BBD72D4
MNTLFPIYLKLDQLHTLLVGAGEVGLEKIQALLGNSPQARISVIALEVSDAFRQFISDKPLVDLEQRAFLEADIAGKQLIIMATNNPEFNEEVRGLANKHHVLLNIADKPSLCDFYLGSVVQKGNLKIGISTNGKSPTMAKRIKELLNDLLPEEIDETLNLMSTYRDQLQGDLKAKIKALNAHTENLLHYESDRAH